MGTRVVRIPDLAVRERAGFRRLLDPAGTVLTVAVSASVLAASLLIASLSTDPRPMRAIVAGTQPRPAPPPALAAPAPQDAPTSP